MVEVRWIPAPDQHESLALGVQSLLAGAGAAREYAEVVSVLGLGALIAAVPDEPVERWPTFARDAALVESAALLGIRLRDLHPPEAAGGLDRASEFQQHFHDSYLPLMKAALASDQPLLAWCGWPAPAEREWGVLVQTRGDELLGYTVGCQAPLPLRGPALQVYVVEDFDPSRARTAGAALFGHVAQLALALWRGQVCVAPGVRTGEAAWTCWCAALAAADAARFDEHLPAHARLARGVAVARHNLARWLRTVADELSGDERQIALQWASACRQVTDGLAPLADWGRPEPTLPQGAAGARFLRSVEEAHAADARAMHALGLTRRT